MTKDEVIEYGLTFSASYKDYPFDEATVVLRHSLNKKIFALIYDKEDKSFVSLKCDPMEAEFLRSVYQSVTPGWHLNKVHWNTVFLSGEVPSEEIKRMIGNSYDLIKPKKKKKGM